MIRKLILLVLLALPAAAQDAQLFIERIEVRNHKRVSPDVIVAESRLREGREYSEADLRDASTRLGRLPFLLSVDFALEKGSERGKHVLVLTVQETRPFFFLLNAVPYFDPQDGPLTPDDDTRTAGGENFTLGFRWFVGRRGAVHLGLAGFNRNREFSREYGGFAVGYTQYDLFGTRAFATLNLKRPIMGSGEGKLSPQVVVGVPLAANQTVTLEYDEARFTRGVGSDYESSDAQRIVSARWAHNTTNEPFFPTRGALVHAGPVVGWTDGAVRYSSPEGAVESYATHSRFYGIEGGAARYFELSDRDSVWADFRADWLRNRVRNQRGGDDFDETTNYASVGVGYSHSFWSAEERVNGDSRLEVTARFATRSRDSDPGYVILPRPDRRVSQVGTAWVRRSSWGTLRLGVGYAW